MNLPAIQTDKKQFALLEYDHAPKMAEKLGLDLTVESNVEKIKEFFLESAKVLAPHTSGLVLDPIYSFDLSSLPQKKNGVLFRLTTLHAEVDPLAVPILLPDWGVDDTANNYGMAKIELYYHPAEEKALQKKQLLADLFDYCQYRQIKLLVKLMLYTPADQEFDEAQFQVDQLQAVQEFRKSADILALQYPLGPLAAATLTADLDIPWLLLTQSQTHDQFKQDLRICLENGAAGYMLDACFWQDLQELKTKHKAPDWEKIEQFVQTELRDRLIELTRITDEAL